MAKIELIIASSNHHKLIELRALFGSKFHLKNLVDLGYTDEISETGSSFSENALIKARHVHRLFGGNVLSDDSGLVVDALNGAPGIYSARYAGVGCSSEENVAKLLREMASIQNRSARFVAVLAFIYRNKEYLFEGTCEGTIVQTETGTGGFGYDPVFVPSGYAETFAQMASDLKNSLSHRGVAFKKLLAFLHDV